MATRRPEAAVGFTEQVKQELSRLAPGSDGEQRAELMALVRLAGSLHLGGDATGTAGMTVDVVTSSGAVARRVYALLHRRFGVRAELRVRAPDGVRSRSDYAVVVPGAVVTRELGLADADGRLSLSLPGDVATRPRQAAAFARGAFLAAGSVSRPGRPAHLEIGVAHHALAEEVAAVVRQILPEHTVTAVAGDPPRVVCKSGEAIGELLTAMGATNSFLLWDERRLRRSLRSEANRLANADAANLRRAVEAAAAQTATVEAAISAVGWEGLGEDLRQVALARLANPSASLSEVGELCDPPVGKSAVFRRLQRLRAFAEGDGPDAADHDGRTTGGDASNGGVRPG